MRRLVLASSLIATFAVARGHASAADDNGNANGNTTKPSEAPTTEPPRGAAGRTGSGLGLAPDAPPVGGLVLPQRASAAPRPTLKVGELRTEFHGFLRAPVRLGLHDDGGRLRLSSPGHVPDSEYQSWQYTNTAPGPWVQLNLSVGNPTVTGTVVLGTYSISDAGYHNLSGQQGTFQAFITLRVPHFAGTPARLEWTLGSFSNRYGAMGKFDAGKYETVIMGRTHLLGETAALSMDFGPWILSLEHGFGAKANHLIGTARSLDSTSNPDLYGEGHLGSTLAHHGHIGVAYRSYAQLGLHYMHSFTHEQIRGVRYPERILPDASTRIVGADVRVDFGAFGYGYLGYSMSDMRNLLYLQNAIEALHSFGGVATSTNFFPDCPILGRAAPEGAPMTDPKVDLVCSGRIHSVGLQYTLSIGSLLRRPEPFSGNGPDLLVTVFGIFNSVKGRDDAANTDTTKLKYGAEMTYVPLAWLALSGRFDQVNPDMRDSSTSFTAISPRIVFRTSVWSNEQVVLGYTRYFNGDGVTAPAPHQAFTGKGLDANLLYLAATMWW